MAFILKTWILVLFVSFASAEDKCPPLGQNLYCTCMYGSFSLYGFESGVGTKVECSNINNPSDLYREVQKFRSYHIDYFKLMNSNLPYLPAGLFQGTTVSLLVIENSNLKNLYSVSNASPSPFEGLEESLKEVMVRNTNEPTNWYWPDLSKFKNLSKFNIIHSPINFVGHNFAEIGGGSLKQIVVRNSNVNRIHPQAFPELTGLVTADFESNHLVYLVRTMFANPAPELEILHFKNNRLFTLDENMFENMPALIFLDISGNEFKKFQTAAVTPIMNQLQRFLVADNPYECGCSLAPLKQKLGDKGSAKWLLNDLEKVTCINHGQFRKTHLKDLDTGSLRC